MSLSRRQFLKWASVTGVGAVIFNGCRVPDEEIQVQSPVELPEDLVTGRDNYYATVAQLGGASEGLLVRVMEGRAKKVEGNPDYPLNKGKHHLRAEALLQATYHPDRIKTPLARIAKGGPFRPIGWPEAIQRLSDILEAADPSSVLIATDPLRGRLADVAKRFASAYGAELLGYEALEQTVLHAAVKRVFDQDVLPDFDIAKAGFLVSFGSDFLGTWMDTTHFMGGYGEFRQSDTPGHERGHLVQIDSRFSLTAAAADEWLFVKPGSEGLLAMAMIQTIVAEGLGNADEANALTDGNPGRLDRFKPSSVANEIAYDPAKATELAGRIEDLARRFASADHGPSLAIGGGSTAAHTNGLFNLTAVYSLNYLVGSVNGPSGVIKFNPADLQSRVPGASVREWKQALDSMRSGETKVLLLREANIEYGLPGALDVAAALESVETIVSFSSFLDETTARADLILPGHTQLEEWGTDTPDLGPGYSTVAFQQPVINRFRDTVAFGDVLLQTAKGLDLSAELPWDSMREAVRDTARELHATGRGSVFEELPVGASTFEEFWKRALELGGWWDEKSAVSGAAPMPPALPTTPVDAEISGDSAKYPLSLVPFEGHGVGSGQYSHLPWVQAVPDPLTTVAWETWVELNPKTAEEFDLHDDDVVTIDSPTGKFIRAAVYVNPGTPPGVAGVPAGQGHQHFTSYAARRGANVWDLIDPELMDAETGALAWAATRVRVSKSNERRPLPKLEGLVEARQLPGEPVIEVLRLGKEA